MYGLEFVSLRVLTERNTGKVYGTKIFKPKKIGGYPTENFFGKLSTLETYYRGKRVKSHLTKKSYNRKLTKNLNSDRENQEIDTFKYKKYGLENSVKSILCSVL